MTPPVSSVPVILEKTAARRMVWVLSLIHI